MQPQNLTPAQQTTVGTEINNDPESLGYATPKANGDLGSLIVILTCVRDGVTPCPYNQVVGPTNPITGATSATPIVITSANHGLSTGALVVISGVGGNTAANGNFTITKIDANTFSLNTSVWTSGAYTSGGVWVPGTRQTSVSSQTLFGAIGEADLITNGIATAITADQQGKIMFAVGLLNQPSGNVILTNAEGSDNNNSKTLKAIVSAGTPSKTAIAAAEIRNSNRIEQILGISGIVPTQNDIRAALGIPLV